MEIEKKVTVLNKQGLHVRPAMKISELASKFSSDIALVKEDKTVNPKSILDILTLAATKGSELTLKASGDDAEKAVDALARLIEKDYFDEFMQFKDTD